MFRNKKDNLKYEFLPSALEITETPPNKYGSIVLWILVLLIVTALVWAYFGRIDIVATARGKVVPDGSVKVVQASAGGVVTAINVSDGDTVKEGELLVELDATSTQADVASIESSLATARLERDVLKKLASGESIDTVIDESSVSPEIKEDIRALARSQGSSYQVERQFAVATVSQAREQLNRENTNLTNAQNNLNEARTNQQPTQAAESTVQTMTDRVAQARSALNQAQANLASIDSNNGTTTLGSVLDQDKAIADLESSLQKAKKTVEDQSVYAPVNGTIMTLAVNTVGGVVNPSQQLAIIVPDDTPLIVEASLQNQDIGFVSVGQKVALKLDTFSFQRYGTLEGKVKSISPDAVQDETTGFSTYKMKIEVVSNKSSKEKEIQLLSGMAVTSEIKTGDRQIISFFLDPLIAGTQESMRVR